MIKPLSHFVPKTLSTRVFVLILTAALLSQLGISFLWFKQQQEKDLQSIQMASEWMAENLENRLKPLLIALDQTSNSKKSKEQLQTHIAHIKEQYFFSSLPRPIQSDESSHNTHRQTVLNALNQHFSSMPETTIKVTASIIPASLLLPITKQSIASVLFRGKQPIIVLQFKDRQDQHFVVATGMPPPHSNLESTRLEFAQWGVFVLSFILLVAVVFTITRWLTQPLKQLAAAADVLGRDLDSTPIPEIGSTEVVQAAKAFNAMQMRLQRFVQDRETLFSAISHDLKTPITRMRLRAELLDEENHRDRFIANLDELDMMVKGALQSVKDTDIHENPEAIDINQLLKNIQVDATKEAWRIRISGAAKQSFRGKPLAIKRCISNLIDNALKYGNSVHVIVKDRGDNLYLYFHDQGPGIPLAQRSRVFEPYVRLASTTKSDNSNGLGLGIVRNIIHAHGGQIALNNHPHGGLVVRVLLPRKQDF